VTACSIATSPALFAKRSDPDARLYKKARRREAHLGYLGHVLMEHRSGPIVNATVTLADGHGERDAALVMVEAIPGATVSPSR
jgi:hypothetical protein